MWVEGNEIYTYEHGLNIVKKILKLSLIMSYRHIEGPDI